MKIPGWVFIGILVLLLISIGGNVFQGINNSNQKNQTCIPPETLSAVQNQSTLYESLYNQSQGNLSNCQADLNNEKKKGQPIIITINYVWTFIIGVTLGTILWWFFKFLLSAMKNEGNKNKK